jgi:DNA-binding response OmpR family regulator
MTPSRDKALLIRKDEEGITEWPLAERTTLGRDESCDVCLPDRTVSRLHATVTRTDDGYRIVDHDSKNGTWVNGAPVGEPHLLEDGDEVSIATSYKLYFVDAEATAPVLFEARGLRVDHETVMVFVNGEPLDPPLSGPQFELLRMLVEAQGNVVSRDEVVRRVWPEADPGGVSEDAVDALIRRLRLRLAEADPDHTYIVTVRGYGFRLVHP